MDEYRVSKKSFSALVNHIENTHRRAATSDDDAERLLEIYWDAISSKSSRGRDPSEIRRLFTLYETVLTRPLENLDLWDREKQRAKKALHSYLSIYRAIDVNRRMQKK